MHAEGYRRGEGGGGGGPTTKIIDKGDSSLAPNYPQSICPSLLWYIHPTSIYGAKTLITCQR